MRQNAFGVFAAPVIGAALSLCTAFLPSAARADGPAVSQINGKASLEGGEMNAHPAGIAQGSLSVPLGYSFGAQFDAAGGVDNGKRLWGAAGQGFWRNPDLGLLGALAVHSDSTAAGTSAHTRTNRYGGEGALYLGQFTPEVVTGYQHGTKSGGFAVLDLAWYPVDDLRLSGGADLNPGHAHALLGAEFQLGLSSLPGLAVFMESSLSGQRDSYALAGFRLYFGPDKTLIRRHREDDPESPIVDQGITNGPHNLPPSSTVQANTGGNNNQNQGNNQNQNNNQNQGNNNGGGAPPPPVPPGPGGGAPPIINQQPPLFQS